MERGENDFEMHRHSSEMDDMESGQSLALSSDFIVTPFQKKRGKRIESLALSFFLFFSIHFLLILPCTVTPAHLKEWVAFTQKLPHTHTQTSINSRPYQQIPVQFLTDL
ncbi:hypothetical protein OUZ56_004696 [Daphnia magna]|uniref:Transmembrane protein n=1 Tax=Daphnia magna TaxID=35525 RepID=A0ABQ9YQK5_9CRUS|nr:hypothetical protein OUZ56_004696 [Daphnia magna]